MLIWLGGYPPDVTEGFPTASNDRMIWFGGYPPDFT